MKLYISPCPNDTFMFDALINKRIDTKGLEIDVEFFDIEQLNTRALSAEAEFSKISCAILPSIQEKYNLCESGAALGRGNGPLLVRSRTECVASRSLLVPGFNTTANLLVNKFFSEYRQRKEMLFSDIPLALQKGENRYGVLIHEGRFLLKKYDLELIADLGSLWEERMKLPLPLGGIVMRRDLSLEIQQTFSSVLSESISYAFANPAVSREFVKLHARELDDEVIDAHISLFVNEFSLQLGKQGQEAINRLLAD